MEKVITRTAEYSYLEGGVLLCKLKEGMELDVADVEENIQGMLKITGGKRYAILTDARVQVTITSEGMAYGARPELNTSLIAQAILVNSLANRLVGNFIIQFHKPKSPTRLFSNYEDAYQWLLGKLEEEQMAKKGLSKEKAR